MQFEHIGKVFGVKVSFGRQVEIELDDINDRSRVYLHSDQCRELGLLPDVASIWELAELPLNRWPKFRFVVESVAELPWPKVDGETQRQELPISLHIEGLSLRPSAHLKLVSGGTGGTISVMYMPVVRLVLPATPELIAEVESFPPLHGGFLLHSIERVPEDA